MSMSSGIGANIQTNKKEFEQIKFLFGEDQSRYVIEVNKENVAKVEQQLQKQNIYFMNIGETSSEITIDDDLKFNLNELTKLNKEWFYKYNN